MVVNRGNEWVLGKSFRFPLLLERVPFIQSCNGSRSNISLISRMPVPTRIHMFITMQNYDA